MKRPSWRQVEGGEWQYLGSHGVYGIVSKSTTNESAFYWEAAVMWNYQLNGKYPKGLASTLEGAKKVVELLCEVTEVLTNHDYLAVG